MDPDQTLEEPSWGSSPGGGPVLGVHSLRPYKTLPGIDPNPNHRPAYPTAV